MGFSPSRADAAALVLLIATAAPLRAQCPDGSPPPCGPVAPRMPRSQVLPFATLASDTTSPSDGTAATIILVRHAERAAEPAGDPVLSPAGQARAAALADSLAGLGITAVVTTQFQRTRLTAAPLAQARGLTPVVVATSGGLAAHVRAVADTARALTAAGPVLVVGHSNTVPRIVAALGGPALPDLCETEHASLFVMVLQPGAPPSLTRARYGVEDPPPGPACSR
jgi:broad specificity phosphatase PhoE